MRVSGAASGQQKASVLQKAVDARCPTPALGLLKQHLSKRHQNAALLRCTAMRMNKKNGSLTYAFKHEASNVTGAPRE